MKLQVLELTEEDRAGLLRIVERGRDWRMRHRAQTLLYFGDGWRAKAIAAQQSLHLDTVYNRRKHWLTDGFASLVDKHRCGAPAKVSAAQREQLRMWATPRDAQTLEADVDEILTGFGDLRKLHTKCSFKSDDWSTA